MKHFDFVIIGAGIAGLLSAWFLRDFNILLVDEDDILEGGASKAAGAFLFPKVGFDTAYTRFINNGIIEALNFYANLGINVNKKGVLILPRDEKDKEKFKKYAPHIKLPFSKKEGGFFFEDGGVIEVSEVKEKLKVPFKKEKIEFLKQEKDYWLVNNIKTKNVILATGAKQLIEIPYIKINPIWGERIEIKSNFNIDIHYHKNCSLAKVGNIFKIGATHKRGFNGKENMKEALELINKAREIKEIKEFEITKIVGGFRAASSDFFPVVGEVIDLETLKKELKIVNGVIPKNYIYKKGLYIVNGMGGRGFSNALMCAKALREKIVNNKDLGILDLKRTFIKWARREGKNYLL